MQHRNKVLYIRLFLCNCVKNVHIRSFSGPYFPAFGLNKERYRVLRIFPYSVQIRENKGQKNSEYGHFSRSMFHYFFIVSLYSAKTVHICAHQTKERSEKIVQSPIFLGTLFSKHAGSRLKALAKIDTVSVIFQELFQKEINIR